MPRPDRKTVTFSIDGREVQAPENQMLVDAAKHGDVEIPYFCYEPKLGQPVGACRMCLVEIEGIPKLQVACSTPVKDGMVVHTQTARVQEAQRAVVEFLLINHPLDCPVCDKGGECPLQDITFGWGSGRSRFIEPKRHFVKPLELSPLIAIDRERCILCYRCVRFSQEIAEDYQLVLLERGAQTYVATYDGHPYVAPFSGNITELCPVGALTSKPYRFRARPWDIEGSGSLCTLCPSQCNVSFTVRDDRVLRVMARDHEEVDDGWLCDKGRFAYQAIHVEERVTRPMVREGGELRPVSWERALDTAARALERSHGAVGAIAAGGATNEEGFLLARLLREGLGSPHLDSRRVGAPADAHRALGDPALQASVPDLEYAHAVLVLDCEPVDDMPIVDLRIRKGVRRNRVKLAVATSRPSTLDPNAALSVRFAPGCGAAFAGALAAALDERSGAGRETGERKAEQPVSGTGGEQAVSGEPRGDGGGELDRACRAAGADAAHVRALAELLATAGDDVVILYGERALTGAGELVALADGLGLRGRDGAGLLGVPAGANGRGLREVGFLPDAGPGLAPLERAGHDTAGIARAAADGELAVLYLLHTDPLRDLPDGATWERALERASTVIAHAGFLTKGLRRHATVVFPSESYAEQEGTVTHPDGRLQRLRPAIGHQGENRYGWQVIAEVSKRAGFDQRVLTGGMAFAQMVAAVPFYAGLTLEELGGRGIRWTEREQGSAFPAPERAPERETPASPDGGPAGGDGLRLGTYRSIWAAPEVERSPALKFLHPRQRAELSPRDAERLGVRDGEEVVVGSNGTSVRARAVLRRDALEGTVFLEEAIPEDAANVLTGPTVEVRRG